MASQSYAIASQVILQNNLCAIGSNANTLGVNCVFVGGSAGGSSATTNSSNSIAVGALCNIGSMVSNVITLGYNCTINGSSNSIAIGTGAFSNNANTMVVGSSTNPLIPVLYSTPCTYFRTAYQYTGSKNFTTDTTLGAAPLISGLVIFAITSNSTVTLPSASQCLAQLHDYVDGSYVWGYMSNTNSGSASLSIIHTSDTRFFGPTSLTAGQGVRFVIKVNGTSVDYIM